MSFWDFFWLLIWTYLFVAYLVVLFHIAADIFRDPDLGGFAKALWVIALIVAPFLTALIYLIARGRGMAERQAAAAQQARAETDQYIQYAANNAELRRPDRLSQGPARRRHHHPGRVRTTEGESTRLNRTASRGVG